MTAAVLLALTLATPAPSPSTFDTQTELQALYDEMSQTVLQAISQRDLDEMRDVLYSPDWVFVDPSGSRKTWAEWRAGAVAALGGPKADDLTQGIRKITLDPDGATTVVNSTIVRTIVDAAGRFGTAGASHTVSETTAFRDHWVRHGDGWQLASRQQLSAPVTSVDKASFDTEEKWESRHLD